MGRWIALAVKIGVTALLAYLALRAVDFTAVEARWAVLDPLWLIPAAALVAVQLLVSAWRWRAIGAVVDAGFAMAQATRGMLISMFFNQTLPSVVGGDAMRIWLTRDVRGGVRAAVQAVLIDRGAGLLALLALVALCLPGSWAVVDDASGRTALLVIVAGGFGGATVFFLLAIVPRLRLGVPAPLAIACRFAASAVRALLRPRPGVAVWIASIVVHLITVALFLFLARGLGLAIAPLAALYLVLPVILITVLPITIAGWGLREGAMITALGYIDVPAADALAVSVLFGLVYLLTGALGGAVWLATGGERPSLKPLLARHAGRI